MKNLSFEKILVILACIITVAGLVAKGVVKYHFISKYW